MSQYGSWSVKGVDDRARAIAKEKARLKGITLGDYINNLLLDGHSEAGPRDLPRYPDPRQPQPYAEPGYGDPRSYGEPMRPQALDGLAQRIEAVEARSTLAITGIDQSVLGLLARLETTENSTAAMTAEVERMIDELRETHEVLTGKVSAIEADDSGQRSLESMKALEDALGKLATHVYEENRLHQDEATAMKGRVEGGFSEMNDRVEGMELKVESTLAEAAQRVEKAVEQAELRAEGTARHISERVSTMESSIATKLAKVDDVDGRVNTVERDVSGAIQSMEATLVRVQERLNRAEQTTDKALSALEGTFASLDQRINHIAEQASPEKATALRQELEQRIDALAADLRGSVDESRRHLADEIERAIAGNNPDLMGALETRVNALETAEAGARLDGVDEQINHLSNTLVRHVEESENRSAAAIEKVGEQVVGLSETLHQRVAEGEQRNAEAIEKVGGQVDGLADTFAQRIADSERRSAGAIEQVGQQVATAIKHVQARQEQSQRKLAERVAGSESRQEARLSDALSNISTRLADMQSQTATAVSPVQRAIVSLASRLEALEDFNAPPLAEPAPAEPLPDMPALEVDETPIEMAPAPEPEPMPDYEAEATDAVMAAIDAETAPEPKPAVYDEPTDPDPVAAQEEDFISSLPDFDDEPAASEPEEDVEPEALFAEAPDDDLAADNILDDASIEAAEDAAVEDWQTIEDPTESVDPVEASDVDARLEEESIVNEASTDETDALAIDDTPEEIDPLAELGSWEDSQAEARDSDIFASDEDDASDDDGAFLPAFDDVELAHNTEDFEADAAPPEEEFDPTTLDEAEPSAEDYLSRARDAAIAAATDTKSERRGRRSAASTTPKPSTGRKFPIIAAASVLALSAAGAGAWVALRGKVPFTDANAPSFETKTSLAEAGIQDPNDIEPSLTGVEFTEADGATLDETLFEEEGSVAGTVEDTASASVDPVETPKAAAPIIPAAPVEMAAPNVSLPVIPASVSREQAALNGDAVAQYQLGVEQLEAQDYAAAAELISAAARDGLPAAQYRLAKLHERGLGVPRDFTEARAWTERAANGGNVRAMHDLAVFFADGEGGSQSYAAAAEWFRKAADFGLVDSQFNMGVLYENGLGISPNQIEALYWYEIAAANGDASAPGYVQTLRAALPLEQAQQAQRRASTWAVATPNAAANGEFGPQAWSGANRDQVLAVQTVLNGLGYDAGSPDGLAGAGTRTAIRAFQADNGLETTGTIEASLIEALNQQAQGLAG
ncbi:MAG: peptidoglycan-binding protein [Pseudomonadota bacterium]